MILRARVARPEDFIGFQNGLAFAYGPDPRLRERLPEFWSRALPRPGFWSQVVEDLQAPADRRLVFHSLSAFISPGYLQELQESSQPFLAAKLMRRFLEKEDEPIDLDGMREAVAGPGLNVVTVHSASPLATPGQSAPPAIAEFVARRSFDAMRGYRIGAMLREVFSPEGLEGYTSGGWRERTRYGHEGPPSVEHPCLLGVSRGEMREESGARMAEIFVDRPPRLGLRRLHRELLEAALEGLTDEELGDRLCLSVSAVKKRWLSVYDHVDRRAPGLLPYDAARPERSRGAERRRHLLNFLRDHPEEFRSLED